MTDRLTAADMARMRAEHVPYKPYPHIDLIYCHGHGLWKLELWPCDAALLLAYIDIKLRRVVDREAI